MADAHAITLLLVPAFTLFVCVRRWGQPTLGRLMWTLLAASLAGCCLSPLGAWGVHDGAPIAQALAPLVCIVLVSVCVGRVAERVKAILSLAVALVGLCAHYQKLVSGPDYIGRPARAHAHDMERQVLQRQAYDVIWTLAHDDPAVYPPGWLADAPFMQNDRFVRARTTGRRIVVRALWHSPFTNLHAKRIVRMALWFPGGTAVQGASRLEWRDQ